MEIVIQPLKSSRTSWLVYWIEFDEPVPQGNDFFLPTLLVVVDGNGVPVAAPTVMEELDQVRVETVLLRLFEKLGTPDRVQVAASDDWDDAGWEGFAEEQRVEIKIQQMVSPDSGDPNALAGSVIARLAGPGVKRGPQVAQGLLRSALKLRSLSRKEAHLRLAVSMDPDCSEARIELADMEFQKGNWKACAASYEEVISREGRRFAAGVSEPWEDRSTRPYLRAIYGKAMTFWHRGRYAEAASLLERLLVENPKDNQGSRFFVPLLHLLAEDLPAAAAAFAGYAASYPQDYPEPALLFGWALSLAMEGEESAAREKYREGILRNLFIAPMLLEEPPLPRHFWLPNDRAEAGYASEFVDSYAVLWDRESSALRQLREIWHEMESEVASLVAHRERMLDFQDQRYEPDFKSLWQAMLDEDDRLSRSNVTNL